MTHIVVHYHELALKGQNRPFFIRRLEQNILNTTRGAGVRKILRLPGRLILVLDPSSEWKVLRERLEKVFGIANFSPAHVVPVEMEPLKQAVLKLTAGMQFQSFRIHARRGDKSLPIRSMEVNAAVGECVRLASGARVDLDRAELTIYIEMLRGKSYCYFEQARGPGGLPVGVSGTVATLLSGGIDSPLAAYRMMKRGARSLLIHFHSHPFLNRTSQEKARDLAQLLTAYQRQSRLYMVPFGELQREVVASCPVSLRVILYRRFMMRIAEHIAVLHSCGVLVTGESLGQVASQTLENISVIQEATRLPVLRPLIGLDKEEIIQQARKLGSYEISIIPDQDCCRLFVPKHPATRSTLDEIRLAEKPLDLDGLVRSCVERAEALEITA